MLTVRLKMKIYMTSQRRDFLKKMGLGLGMIGIAGPLFAKSDSYYQLSKEQQEFIEEYEASVNRLKTAAEGIGSNPNNAESAAEMLEVSEKMASLHNRLEPLLEDEIFKAYYFQTVETLSKQIGG
jgi:hypothetical protein